VRARALNQEGGKMGGLREMEEVAPYRRSS